ncbi:MAG: hypothetical protein MUP11_02685 [Anaerolineales bacterium]|nr:hypothetical protein [Anaerolineales bacterium]
MPQAPAVLGVGRTLIEKIDTTTSPSHKQNPSVHAYPALIALLLDDYQVDWGQRSREVII